MYADMYSWTKIHVMCISQEEELHLFSKTFIYHMTVPNIQ